MQSAVKRMTKRSKGEIPTNLPVRIRMPQSPKVIASQSYIKDLEMSPTRMKLPLKPRQVEPSTTRNSMPAYPLDFKSLADSASTKELLKCEKVKKAAE